MQADPFFLEALGASVGVPMSFDPSGRCVLICEGGMRVEITHLREGGTVSLTAPVLDYDPTVTTELYAFASLRQLDIQVRGMADPNVLKAGLTDFARIMPAAGRRLENFHHMDSMVRDMAALAETIRTADDGFSLAGTPIIIIDRSDAIGQLAVWDDNHGYRPGVRRSGPEAHSSGLSLTWADGVMSGQK